MYSVGFGRRVADPLSRGGVNGLSGPHFERAALKLHAQHSFQDDGELVKFRRLAWFHPSTGTAHVGDAQARFRGIHMADKFVDQLGFIAGGGDAGG